MAPATTTPAPGFSRSGCDADDRDGPGAGGREHPAAERRAKEHTIVTTLAAHASTRNQFVGQTGSVPRPPSATIRHRRGASEATPDAPRRPRSAAGATPASWVRVGGCARQRGTGAERGASGAVRGWRPAPVAGRIGATTHLVRTARSDLVAEGTRERNPVFPSGLTWTLSTSERCFPPAGCRPCSHADWFRPAYRVQRQRSSTMTGRPTSCPMSTRSDPTSFL